MADETQDLQQPELWTAADVAAHCGWLAGKGYMNKSTATAQRIAVSKIFSTVEGDDWESVDVRQVDMEDVLARFEQLARASRELSPDSIPTYQSRGRKAVEAYLAYQKDGTIVRSQRRSRSASSEANGNGNGKEKPSRTEVQVQAPALDPPVDALVAYPFPLRKGILAQLHLPTDLRKKEAERIARYVMSLVVDEQEELAAGTIAVDE